MKSAEMKREEAMDRFKIHEQRTVTEQLDILSRKSGKAAKETAKLQSKLETFNFEGMSKESKRKPKKDAGKKKGVKKPKVRGVQKSKEKNGGV